MKKVLFLISAIFAFTVLPAFCIAESVSPELEQSLRTQNSEPNIMSIIFALLFVIFLIYITGIVYSKLNIVGAKTVKEQLRGTSLNRAVVISTTQLGQNKNLHVIEINEKYYLIGATINSINLIKELGSLKETLKEETKQKPDEEEIDKAIRVLYGGSQDEIIEHEDVKDEFNVHKKYL